jgi:dipeptidyl aminopeptidase/acylaminoacyl peptidase
VRAWRTTATGGLLLLLIVAPGAGAAISPLDLPAEMAAFRLPSDVALSPDGLSVAYTVWRSVIGEETSEDRGTIWVASTDGAHAAPLTGDGLSAFDPRWSPDGRSIAFLSSRSGDEQVWLTAAAGGEPWRLTASAAPVHAYRWLPEGRAIVYVAGGGPSPERRANERRHEDARVVDRDFDNARLWRVSLAAQGEAPHSGMALTPAILHVATGVDLSFGHLLSGFDVSPDGRSVVFTHMPTPRVNDWPLADLSIVDLQTGELRALAATRRAEGAPRYSPDGKTIAFSASDDPPTASFAARVYVAPAAGDGVARALAPTADERPRIVGWSAEGREVNFTEVRGTVIRLSALPVDGGPPRDLDTGDRVLSSVTLDPERTSFGFVAERADEAPQVWTTPADHFAPRQVSHLAAPLPPAALGRTEVLRWQAADGREIEGLLTYPSDYEPGRRYPLLLVVHGGPTYYFVQDYLATPDVYPLAAFAARGFALLRPNPRGSSGRGRDFRFANRGDWGGKDYGDLMAGVDRAIEIGVADPERLGVMGWSYGGYMTDWIVSQTRRFRAASAGAGVVNLTSFAGTTDIFEFLCDYFGGDPWDLPELYLARSPLFHLAGATTPTLIQHGAEDQRVPVSQSWELYRALRHLGVETELVIYPRQPHGLDEPKLLLDAARRNLEWFTRHLLGAAQ